MSITEAALKSLLRWRKAGLVPIPTPEGEQEILRVFGERAAGPAQVEEAATRLLDRCQYHPKPADVAAVFDELAENGRSPREFVGLGVSCRLCGDTGWVSRDTSYSASVGSATRCKCVEQVGG